MSKFSIEEAIGFGWSTVKKSWTTLIPAVIGLYFVSSLINKLISRGGTNALYTDGGFQVQNILSNLSGSLLTTIVSVIFSALVFKVCLQYVDGKATDFSTLFDGITPELLVKIIFASILFNIGLGIGLVLLVIPGIYFALRYSMVTYVIIDKNAGIKEAFDESARLTEGVKIQLIIFGISCLLVCLLGLIALFVGLFVAIPVVSVAAAHVYRQLTKTVGKAPKMKVPGASAA
jgi:uncharacterized membrane protein